jgi:hypothetical protein
MCSGRVAVPAPSQESMRSCIHVLCISMLSISTILRLDFGNVLTVWYVLLSFHSNKTVINCIGDKPKDNEHLQFLPSKSIMGIIPVTTDSFCSNFFFYLTHQDIINFIHARNVCDLARYLNDTD